MSLSAMSTIGHDATNLSPSDQVEGSQHVDVYIAVMGITGSGKSRFISHCTEAKVAVGHGLRSCTQEIGVYEVKYDDTTTVWLVDSPGFDDDKRSDTVVLKEIAAWLVKSYREEVQLHGIIYLHGITSERLGGSGMRNLSMFKKLCGKDALKNVVLATTKWDKIDPQEGQGREDQLKTEREFWGEMMENGSTVLRHQDTKASAMALIDFFVQKPAKDATTVLELQKEMIVNGKKLDQTGAGREVDDGMSKQREEFEEQLQDLQKDLEEAKASNDQKEVEQLHIQRMKMESQMKDLVKSREDLKIDMERLLAEKEVELRKWYDKELAFQKKQQEDKLDNVQKAHESTVQQLHAERKGVRLWTQVQGATGPSADTMENWPVSLSLFGNQFWFAASRMYAGTRIQDFPEEPGLNPNVNCIRWAAVGEKNSWYVQYRKTQGAEAVDVAGEFSCCRDYSQRDKKLTASEFSDNFRIVYAKAYAHLQAYPDEEVMCMSLSVNGHYFLRTASGCSHNLPQALRDKLDAEPSLFLSVWMGNNGSFVSQRIVDRGDGKKFISERCDLKGGYPGLEEEFARRKKPIKALALNPNDISQYVILWADGAARYNHGLTNFDPNLFRRWCTNNFGTWWENSEAMVGEAQEYASTFFHMERGARKWYAPWKRNSRMTIGTTTSTRKYLSNNIASMINRK